ncbi:hypothetical protein ACLE20_09945 [Rhizobium sp. YIM 134829]|uniref:D-apionate lactonase n=1 Tax=Rhizobium sp. YIM 134829 TaxID=3390453 RepID=UPI00397C9C37
MRTEAFLLTGTEAQEAPVRQLRAGRLTAEFAAGALRAIRYDGIEVLRSIAFLVRDRDWGTYDPALADLQIEEGPDGFDVSYKAECHGPQGTRLTITAEISGREGQMRFAGRAETETGFETNRCGFCILHPIIGLAGAPVTVEHTDGLKVDTVLPDLIAPWQPFKDMRAITHAVAPGIAAECRMDGDIFEMEDQRNWSDASYKTYVRPLALPWPFTIAAGEVLEQLITLTITDSRAGDSEPRLAEARSLRLEPGEARGTLPRLGLIVTPDTAEASAEALRSRRLPAAQSLLFHYDPLAGHDAHALAAFAGIAAVHAGDTTLEIALPCRDEPALELAAIARDVAAAGLRLDAVMVSPAVDRQSTPPGSTWPACPPLEEVYDAARTAFPTLRLAGGMLSYFTELNRKRVPAARLDLVSHCTNPIVHASDDRSVMQTLEALPFITRSVRSLYPTLPYRIGPSTIPMRQNPYGSRTMDNPSGSRIPMANRDPRHSGLFGAAFALGMALRTVAAGLEMLTLSAVAGPFGLIAGEGEPAPAGTLRPLATPLAWLAELAGQPFEELFSSDPSALLSLRVTRKDGVTILLVNLTPEVKHIDVAALELPQNAGLRQLDSTSIEAAAHGELGVQDLNDASLDLQPYALIRIDA